MTAAATAVVTTPTTRMYYDGLPFFEISAINADKPALSITEIERRVEQFRKAGVALYSIITFYHFVFETQRHNGIAELLEVFGSVISGFALHLKEEHKIFLWRVLVPLHKPKSVGVYLQQLTYCVTQFLEKDPKLASSIIIGLLRYWPITNSQKEVMFLSEIEEILEATSMLEFQKCIVPLFRRIAHCINSSHFQVAERALFMWNNDHLISLMALNRQGIMPIIVPALEQNSQNHWNQAVLDLTANVMKMFSEMDEEHSSIWDDYAGWLVFKAVFFDRCIEVHC